MSNPSSPAEELKPAESLGKILSDLALKSLEPGSLLSQADIDGLKRAHESKVKQRALMLIQELAADMDKEVEALRQLRRQYNSDRAGYLKAIEKIQKNIDRVAAGKDAIISE